LEPGYDKNAEKGMGIAGKNAERRIRRFMVRFGKRRSNMMKMYIEK
jgi:hypothetical protein